MNKKDGFALIEAVCSIVILCIIFNLSYLIVRKIRNKNNILNEISNLTEVSKLYYYYSLFEDYSDITLTSKNNSNYLFTNIKGKTLEINVNENTFIFDNTQFIKLLIKEVKEESNNFLFVIDVNNQEYYLRIGDL